MADDDARSFCCFALCLVVVILLYTVVLYRRSHARDIVKRVVLQTMCPLQRCELKSEVLR